MIDLAEAQARAVALATALPAQRVEISDARGCVLADDVVTEGPIPPFANSAMDGYAVQAADTSHAPVTLRVAGRVAAGEGGAVTVEPGTAVRIMTGAPVPPGADAIVMIERTVDHDTDPHTVTVDVAVEPGLFVRAAGSDVAAGATVMRAGDEVRPAHVGLLAAAGASTVTVHGRPTVGVLSTGDELVDAPAPLGPGQIRDANRPALLATLAADGVATVDFGAVADSEGDLDAALADAVGRCDLLLTTGGVSMGDHDLMKQRLESFQVAIKPAKPVAMGHMGGTPIIALPGNPVSALVSYELLARPLIRRMAGHTRKAWFRPVAAAITAAPIARAPDGKLHLLRVVVEHDADGRLTVREAGVQASHVLSAMAAANALALVPDGDGVAAGGRVDVMLLG